MDQQKQNNPATKKLLDFLHELANGDEEKYSPLETIVEFLNMPESIEIANVVSDNFSADIDFRSYFNDMDSIKELIKLKSDSPEEYYKILYYEELLLNIIIMAVKCPYIIVLNPDNLFNSFYLQLRIK